LREVSEPRPQSLLAAESLVQELADTSAAHCNLGAMLRSRAHAMAPCRLKRAQDFMPANLAPAAILAANRGGGRHQPVSLRAGVPAGDMLATRNALEVLHHAREIDAAPVYTGLLQRAIEDAPGGPPAFD
jgi:hypothetical protein